MEETSIHRKNNLFDLIIPVTKTFKKNTKRHIHDCLTLHELLTTPLTTTYAEVLAVIKGKEFVHYPSFIKNSMNTRNSNEFCLFHYNHGHDSKR